MTVSLFIACFLVLEVATPLIVEGLKKTLDGMNYTYNSTMLALVVAIVASICSFVYVESRLTTYVTGDWMFCVALIVANWLGSTLGYDKVREIIDKVV